MKWLRGPRMAMIWTVLRIWLGIQWLEAGVHKVTGGFDATGFVHGAIGKAGGDHLVVQGWYANFLEAFALPNIGLFNILIPFGEVLVGVGLIIGAATIPALVAGAFMNLNFLLAGTTSTNPVLYTVAILLMVANTAAYYYGADRILVPYLKQRMINRRHKHKNTRKPEHIPAH
jgi:thiosulfate dehydrogenase (quinone) large subunit